MISDKTEQALADGIKSYIYARRDKKEEDYLKSKPAKNKKTKEVSKAINARLLAVAKRICDDKEAVSAIEKSKKSKEQTPLSFQQQRYFDLLSLIGEEIVDGELHDIKMEFQNYLDELNVQYEPVCWLDTWVSAAKDISFATHVAKLTHSSSKGSSLLDTSKEQDNRYLTTNTLKSPVIDTASANAKSLPIADILKISHDDISVLDCLKQKKHGLFEYLTSDIGQIDSWVKALTEAYDSKDKQSYFLSKQVYFPLSDEGYHLLLPLTSSSLAQAMHEEHRKYFGDKQKAVREQRRLGKFSLENVVSYPNKAVLNITGSNHSNASALNGARGGRIALLPCCPPQWQSKPNSYRQSGDMFKNLSYVLSNEIAELKKYLLLLSNKSLSHSQPDRAAAILNKFKSISSALFDHVLEANVNEEAGWTQESGLPVEQQLLFEPGRDDDLAVSKKNNKEWQMVLSKQFGRWLNKQLNSKTKLNLTPIQSALWTKIFADELREFVAIQEAEL